MIRVNVNAAIVEGGRILLVQLGGANPFWSLPGGGVENGESLHDAVRREVIEETCVEVDVGRLLLVSEYVPARSALAHGSSLKVGIVFAATIIAGTPRLPAVPDETQVGVEWLPLESLAGLAARQRDPFLPKIAPDLIAAIENRLPDPFWRGTLYP